MKNHYIVITAGGTWGRADTAVKAAQNAGVGGSYEDAFIVRADKALVETMSVTGMGGVDWEYKQEFSELLDLMEETDFTLYQRMLKAIKHSMITKGRMRIQRGNLEVLVVVD